MFDESMMESRRREFPALLRRMVRQCGAMSLENGSRLCERCNYTKEHPGWSHRATAEELTVHTPTGHSYRLETGPLAAAVAA